MRLVRHLLAALWIAAALVASLPDAHAQGEDSPWPRQVLTIVSGAARHRFEVEIAATPVLRQRGLMFRDAVPDGTGMLFLFPGERAIHMWMKNTYVPLDMLFIAADGRVVNIAAETVPLSLDIVSSAAPATAVLEIRGGVSRELGIQAGARVLHPAFQATPRDGGSPTR